MTVPHHDLGRAAGVKAVDRGVHLAGEQLVGLLPARALVGNTLLLRAEDTVNAFHIGNDENLLRIACLCARPCGTRKKNQNAGCQGESSPTIIHQAALSFGSHVAPPSDLPAVFSPALSSRSPPFSGAIPSSRSFSCRLCRCRPMAAAVRVMLPLCSRSFALI